MKALLCKEFGLPASLTVDEADSPAPGPKDVKITVRAAGLNFPDTLMIAGKYQVKPPFPFTPGMECSGIVAEVGSGVTRFKPGDRVMAMTGHGSMAEEVVAPESGTFRCPDSMSFEEAAGFPVTYGTAYHALADRGRLQPGQVLLVNGAAGGVGLNAVEIGKVMGATVIACASSDEKLALAKVYGADHVINYSNESVKDRVKGLTQGRGADVVFDPVGGDAFDQALRSIAWGGTILVIGFASGRIPAVPANLVLLKSCDIAGVYWEGFAKRFPEKNAENFEAMARWFESGKLHPHVSATYTLDEVPQAMDALLSRRTTGKLIILTKHSANMTSQDRTTLPA
jgi:NADPH2:quinone reductase